MSCRSHSHWIGEKVCQKVQKVDIIRKFTIKVSEIKRISRKKLYTIQLLLTTHPYNTAGQLGKKNSAGHNQTSHKFSGGHYLVQE